MSTDLVSFSPDNELFIQQQIQTGAYQDRSELLNVSVELLKKRQKLLDHLMESDRQLEAGEYTDYDREGMRQRFEELKARARAKVTAGQSRP